MNLKMQKLFIIVIVNLSLTEAFKEYMRLISNMYNMSNRTSIVIFSFNLSDSKFFYLIE